MSIDESLVPRSIRGSAWIVNVLETVARGTDQLLPNHNWPESKTFKFVLASSDRNINSGECWVFYISGVAGADWLENEKVSFFIRRSAMLNPFGNDGKLSHSNLDGAIPEPNSQPS
jgi:hypothetical protein